MHTRTTRPYKSTFDEEGRRIGANGSDRLCHAVFGVLRSFCDLESRAVPSSVGLSAVWAARCGPLRSRHGCRGGLVAAEFRCAGQLEGPEDRGGSQADVAARLRESTRLRGTGKAPCGLVVRRSGRESRGSRHRVAARRRPERAPTFVDLVSGPVDQVGQASPESRDRRLPPPRSSSATGRVACRGSAASRSPRARDTTRPMRFAHRLQGRSPRPSRRAASAHSKAA
jgi:hypothetical protein